MFFLIYQAPRNLVSKNKSVLNHQGCEFLNCKTFKHKRLPLLAADPVIIPPSGAVTAAACGVSAVNTAKLDRLVLRRDGVSGSDSSTAEPETRRLRRVGVKDASSSNICIFLTDFAGVFLGVLPGVSNGVLGVEPPRALRWGVSWDSNSDKDDLFMQISL